MNDDFIDVDDGLDDDSMDDNVPTLEDERDKMTNSERAAHDKAVRKRIDDLLERKRLKEMLDDEDDWDI
jgi:hypothetical protein